ncbi:hypothetical protein B4080_3642 [Bacillus cereus]|uniref:Uncharacterized protein n=1 Tax=Bacillus cereus (strain G9842) TaxID=405531 RepID=B7IPH0_BACC2|nr:hypothetical protein BCG9842_B1924 [Bacillus cereus G9842]KLA29040.1 hypothetical protein B4080_3642 [Bacillus cereus]
MGWHSYKFIDVICILALIGMPILSSNTIKMKKPILSINI